MNDDFVDRVAVVTGAAGTILTSFYMVLWFEVNQIFTGMIAVSIACGLAAQSFRDAR